MNFEYRMLNESFADEIMKIQDETFLTLGDNDLLRKNTREMFISCLRDPNITIGAFYNNELAGFAILYYPQSQEEELAVLLQTPEIPVSESANFKLCIVREKYRGNSLQYELGKRIYSQAQKRSTAVLCATVSPKNQFSRRNLIRLGYIYDRTLRKYGMERELFYCRIID